MVVNTLRDKKNQSIDLVFTLVILLNRIFHLLLSENRLSISRKFIKFDFFCENVIVMLELPFKQWERYIFYTFSIVRHPAGPHSVIGGMVEAFVDWIVKNQSRDQAVEKSHAMLSSFPLCADFLVKKNPSRKNSSKSLCPQPSFYFLPTKNSNDTEVR